ncbi:hypothetical protein [Burkholderia ubonensis]|uniref:hypothetical protein n=1 Tax=Burkholderia ubonensis TaxID=101571 RepID=UPI0018DFA9F0
MRTFTGFISAHAAAVATGILIASTVFARVLPQKQSPSAGAEVAPPPGVTIVVDGPLEPTFSSVNVSNSTSKQVNTQKEQVEPNDRKSIAGVNEIRTQEEVQKPLLIARRKSPEDSCVFTALMMSVRNQGRINCVSGSLTPTLSTGGFDVASVRVAQGAAREAQVCASGGICRAIGLVAGTDEQPATSTTRATVERRSFMGCVPLRCFDKMTGDEFVAA